LISIYFLFYCLKRAIKASWAFFQNYIIVFYLANYSFRAIICIRSPI
jgi:hypothetical protein